jgi:hypothetical protein
MKESMMVPGTGYLAIGVFAFAVGVMILVIEAFCIATLISAAMTVEAARQRCRAFLLPGAIPSLCWSQPRGSRALTPS